jgi:hypothetical protein
MPTELCACAFACHRTEQGDVQKGVTANPIQRFSEPQAWRFTVNPINYPAWICMDLGDGQLSGMDFADGSQGLVPSRGHGGDARPRAASIATSGGLGRLIQAINTTCRRTSQPTLEPRLGC